MAFSASKNVNYCGVDFVISSVSFDVLITVFERGDAQDGQERKDDQTRRNGCKFGEELQNSDSYK